MSSIFLALPLLDHPSVDARCATGEQYLGADACFLRELLCSIDIAFTIAFTAEMVAKVLASGLLVPYPTAYLRDGWNVLDFFIVREREQPGRSPSVAEAHAAALAIGPRLVGFDRLRLRCLRSGGDGGRPGCLGVAAGAQDIARIARAAPSAHGYVALLYDPTTSGKVNQRHVINNPQAVLMLLRKQINARRLAVLKARAPAIDRGDDELAA